MLEEFLDTNLTEEGFIFNMELQIVEQLTNTPLVSEQFEVWHYYKIDNQSDCRFVFGHKGTDMDLVLSNVEGETPTKNGLCVLENL